MSFVLPAFAVVPVTATALFLAQQPTGGNNTDNGGQGEDFGKSSPVGFLLLIVFLVVVGFLVRSMTKHLKRVPGSFDTDEAAALEAEAAAAKAESSAAAPSAKPAK
ncbi:MAG: hypothetical protein JWQ81_7777 [Amycolatopsis sp.]|jgi:hypothetical protein|uniref:hypothetical protein n=1 Tax=Amycolatopsis sp. TaxID=37632 RepID=UPI00261D26BA|nr:hypothetical protein [Amycolatopsis sp.]MCU1687038.1 hypothetical protein [Amycolatopsis sp.]